MVLQSKVEDTKKTISLVEKNLVNNNIEFEIEC